MAVRENFRFGAAASCRSFWKLMARWLVFPDAAFAGLLVLLEFAEQVYSLQPGHLADTLSARPMFSFFALCFAAAFRRRGAVTCGASSFEFRRCSLSGGWPLYA